jgi:hypothetical protein
MDRGMDIASRVLKRYAYTTDVRKVRPQFDLLEGALSTLIAGVDAGEDLSQGRLFQAYSMAIDAYREVMYFMRSKKAEHLVSKLQTLPLMSKNPFAPDEVLKHNPHAFVHVLGEARMLQQAFDRVQEGWL